MQVRTGPPSARKAGLAGVTAADPLYEIRGPSDRNVDAGDLAAVEVVRIGVHSLKPANSETALT
jgi:hypothetical protein